MKRSDFKAAIQEAAESVHPPLSDDQHAALMVVANTATLTCHGVFSTHDGCLCPAVLAGLDDLIEPSPNFQVLAFAFAFDDLTRHLPRILEIED